MSSESLRSRLNFRISLNLLWVLLYRLIIIVYIHIHLQLNLMHDAIQLRLFLFSLLGRAKQWFYANKSAIKTWDNCTKEFLAKFFLMDKTNALRGRISSFQQVSNKTIPEA